MAIKNNKKSNYTQISNDLLNNANISFGAKGLMAYLESKPCDWTFSYEGICSQTREKKVSVTSTLKELVEAGLVLRVKQDKGIYYDFILYPSQEDLDSHEDPLVKYSDLKNRPTEHPLSGHPPLNHAPHSNTKPSNTKKSNTKKSNTKKSIVEQLAINEIVEHLNKKADTKYKPKGSKTKSLILAKLKEGFTVEDFKKVINTKCEEWNNTDMDKYIRPETLFGNKFESYLNQKVTSKKKGFDYAQFDN